MDPYVSFKKSKGFEVRCVRIFYNLQYFLLEHTDLVSISKLYYSIVIYV